MFTTKPPRDRSIRPDSDIPPRQIYVHPFIVIAVLTVLATLVLGFSLPAWYRYQRHQNYMQDLQHEMMREEIRQREGFKPVPTIPSFKNPGYIIPNRGSM